MNCPTGWMNADLARQHARRGTWSWRDASASVFTGTRVYFSVEDLLADIRDVEEWRLIGCHPDDGESLDEMVKIEAFVCVSVTPGRPPESNAWYNSEVAEEEAQRMRSDGSLVKIVRLVGHTLPPKPEAIEVVHGSVLS